MMRRVATAGLLATAVGGPYVATETEVGRGMTSRVTASVEGTAAKAGLALGSPPPNSHYDTESLWHRTLGPRDLAGLGAARPVASLAGGPVHDFRDLLRFDITPEWIASRFSRVTTVLAELQLDGLRVPLVSGTEADDVAGTVTYYFDRGGRLQRISLHGFTGDATRLSQTMQQYYNLRPQPTLDAGVYASYWNGYPTSVLKVSRVPVMYADAPRAQYTVFLELNQPNLQYGLSAEAARIVSSARDVGRW